MAVCKNKIFAAENANRGASMMEVLLAMAIVAMATPFLYSQIADTNNTIRDMAMAQDIISLRGPVMNFVRLNQDSWPDVAQIRLADEELDEISQIPTAGFIDKYTVRGATTTDVYLAFDLDETQLRTNQVARHIGMDAAVVGEDGVAYGNSWAVAAPDFKTGDLIYRISRDFEGEDKTKYLHRTTSGEDGLNVMLRDLNMGANNIYDAGGVIAKSAQVKSATTTFLETESLAASSLYFSSGANLDGGNAAIGSMRVSGDISGFRNIYADNMNGAGYTTTGRIIADRATIANSVNVARDFVLKSDSLRTISGFTGISANSVVTSYVSAEEMVFYDNFGLTISGELLMSTTSPLKIGSWIFPSVNPPRFNALTFTRAAIPNVPSRAEFGPLMTSGWQSYMPTPQQEESQQP